MNAKIAAFIGAGFATASLALAGPAEAAGGHAAPGHSSGGVGGSSAHVGIQPTSLSADQVTTSAPSAVLGSIQGPGIGLMPSAGMIHTIAGLTPPPVKSLSRYVNNRYQLVFTNDDA